MNEKTLPPIHFFRPGRHTAMSGQVLEFSAADLSACAQAYDPAVYQAPIVVGHPAVDAPAYGWVSAVEDKGAELFASAEQIEPQFADMVRAGRFKKVSGAFFPPAHPRNPVPGVWYLKHIGFLGAAAPAVPGLKPVEYALEDDLVTIEFSEYDDLTNAGMWRRMREWIIGKFGQEEADKVIPGYEVSALEQSAMEEIAEENSTQPEPARMGFCESSPSGEIPAYTNPQEEAMSDADQQRLADLEAENTRLKAREAEFAEAKTRLGEIETTTRRNEIAAFAGDLVKAGRVLPADKDALCAFMESIGADAVIEFGEGDGKVSKPGNTWLREWLARLPVQVDFSERTAPDDIDAPASFAAPDGYGADAAGTELFKRAKALEKSKNITFAAAVAEISKGDKS